MTRRQLIGLCAMAVFSWAVFIGLMVGLSYLIGEVR